jgi:NAD(P)-dependent dehydrogenase (short-subunit alcohol dehydrogenase family)
MPTVLITGASRGLGLEFARQYAADGWDVIATCRDPGGAGDLRALGPRVRIEQMDVADFDAVASVARRLGNETIDVLIANAGINPVRDMSLTAIDAEAWSRTFRVNTMAPLACAAAFLPHVARSGQRKMAAVSSRVGSIAGFPQGGHYVYRSSKTALNSAWHAFTLDHPEVLTALLSPGLVATDMTRDFGVDRSSMLSPAESVGGLRAVIARLKPEDTGGFFHYTGERLPW